MVCIEETLSFYIELKVNRRKNRAPNSNAKIPLLGRIARVLKGMSDKQIAASTLAFSSQPQLTVHHFGCRAVFSGRQPLPTFPTLTLAFQASARNARATRAHLASAGALLRCRVELVGG
ncbi:hypothetical protein [Ralstonia sp. GX3-BWBA]|uniref:hypothetical protein n=1 Tax=Ralstonia sp. GX3-BWBA TaxID=2219865 RepID=UPI0013A68C46|nr:hypothetical protein [Ralstonia sp. GX3-BWBA]